NIESNDSIEIIELFNGIGSDGNGDGKAELTNAEDVLYTAANLLLRFGISQDDIKISLWDYYKRDLSVKTIVNTASVYNHFNAVGLVVRHFPVDMLYNYSYRSTWGHRRGFSGNRSHEGTDIFANYGTPVTSTSYGVVELKAWNLYG